MSRDMSIPEVAERLGVHRVTVHRWVVNKNYFPHAYQVNPHESRSPYRIPEEDVIAFEEKRKEGCQSNASRDIDN